MTLRHSILIIDDTTSFAEQLREKLSQEGYDVQFVATVREALEYLRQYQSPTFILADRMLDDAIEVRDLGTLCHSAPNTKVLVYTYQPLSDEQRSKIIERGAYRVLDKNAVDQLVGDIKVLTQELEELLELADGLQAATSERSKIMAALIGNDVAVSVLDRHFHRWFRNSTQEHVMRGLCRSDCWTASFGQSATSVKCWGCTTADVLHGQRAVDGLFLNRLPNGSLRWVALRATPVFSRTGNTIIAVREAVTEASEIAVAGLPLDQRLHHIAESLIRAGFGRARIYKALSDETFKLMAAAARSDSPRSNKSDYFENIKNLRLEVNDCVYAKIAKERRLGYLVESWDEHGRSQVGNILGLKPPYFDVPIWREDGSADGWISVDFVGTDDALRQKAISQYAKKESLAWLQEDYGREVRRALETGEGKPGHRDKFEIAQRAHLGIASARSVAEATKEIQSAFDKLLPKCRVSVRRRTADSLKEFDSLCSGPAVGNHSSISLSDQQSLAVTVVNSHLPRWIYDYEQYVQNAKSSGEPLGCPPAGTRSTAQIPLQFERTVFGTLSVNSPVLINWDEEGYREPLLALAEDITLVLRDLSLHDELDAAMADRAAIIAYSVSVSADGLWRHWAQQRLAEASVIVARIRHILTNSPRNRPDLMELLLELSSVITRIHSFRPLDEVIPECLLSTVFLQLQELYANRRPLPVFAPAEDFPQLRIPQFILLNILMVLLDNALRAIHDSGRGEKISVDARSATDFIEINVSDDGPGIPPDEQPKVLREALKSNKGRGVGLLYARGAALQYGGDLSFKTSANGTCFTVRLPVSKRRGA